MQTVSSSVCSRTYDKLVAYIRSPRFFRRYNFHTHLGLKWPREYIGDRSSLNCNSRQERAHCTPARTYTSEMLPFSNRPGMIELLVSWKGNKRRGPRNKRPNTERDGTRERRTTVPTRTDKEEKMRIET